MTPTWVRFTLSSVATRPAVRFAFMMMPMLVQPGIAGFTRGHASTPPSDGSELIGTAAAGWDIKEWIGSAPLTLAGLRGKVVVVRWFTSPDCPYCHATAPTLAQLHRDYADRGLAVIGMYHHKLEEPLRMDAVRGWVRDYGYKFPVAIDRDWRTLKRWWLDGHKRDFTSVTFLIDRRGVIRHIHPGGSLVLGKPDFVALQSKIEQLLAEPPAE